MINKLIQKLNAESPTFKILNLHEDNDIDYALLNVEAHLIAVEVDYSGDISFKRIPEDKRNKILQSFCAHMTADGSDEIRKVILT